MNEDAHLEAAYEDRNGGDQDSDFEMDYGPPEDELDETINSMCIECGAAPYVQCAPDCVNVTGEVE